MDMIIARFFPSSIIVYENGKQKLIKVNYFLNVRMYLFNMFNESSEGNDHIINILTCLHANPHFCKNHDF